MAVKMYNTAYYADDVNILGGSIHTLKENAEALVAATREIGLEVSADKTRYMVMSRDQNAGRIHRWGLIIVPSRVWKSLNIWEQLQQIKILLQKKLRADLSQEMLAIIWCRIFCLPG